MRGFTKVLSIAAAGAAFTIALPANAAVFVCNDGGIVLTENQCTDPGNKDNLVSVEAAIAAATGVDVSTLNLTLYGKSDDKNSASLFSFSPTLEGEVLETTFTVLDGTLITYATIKAATGFKVYQFDPRVSTGSVSTEGLLNGGKNQPAISHISFWTTPAAPVPETGTWAMMLFGFGALGFAMRRRRGKEDPRVRYAF